MIMARMIPPVPYEDCSSDGELELFRLLKQDPVTTHWTIVHSLCIAEHPTQYSGEIDFIVIVPQLGVLCIEVKACRSVQLKDGQWELGQKSEIRGPFRQVSVGMHKLRGDLTTRFPSLKNVLFWSAVVFTHCRFDLRSPEWHPWQVIDNAVVGKAPVAQKLRGILHKAREYAEERKFQWFSPQTKVPTLEQCELIATSLRPTYEPLETPADRRRLLERELRRCTDQQLRLLRFCQDNRRLLVKGPAGTGKTYIAIAAAERDLETSRQQWLEINNSSSPKKPFMHRILFVCYNRALGKWLEEELKELEPYVAVKTISRHMLDICNLKAPPNETDDYFWKHTLPEKAVDILLEKPEEWSFDTLIIDEAQDFLYQKYLDVLELSLKGGLSEGSWRMFGDFDRQKIFIKNKKEYEKILSELEQDSFNLCLKENCRNSPLIAHLASELGKLTPPYDSILREDDGKTFMLQFYSSLSEQKQKLEQYLDIFKEEGYSDREITVLSSRSDNKSVAFQLEGKYKNRLVPLHQPSNSGITSGSIHSFKGLENRVIILTDLDDALEEKSLDLFYIGITRAQSRLALLCNDSIRENLQELILETEKQRKEKNDGRSRTKSP
jgi:hypothetical protein